MKKILPSILLILNLCISSCVLDHSEHKETTKEDTTRIVLIKNLFELRNELDHIETRDSILHEILMDKKVAIDSLISRTLDFKENKIGLVIVTKKYEKVKIEKQVLSKKADSLHKEFVKLYGENYRLTEELTNQKSNNLNLTWENTKLKKKVETASNSILTGVKITGIGYTSALFNKPKEYETNKSSKIKSIKVTCVLPPNELAKKENKNIVFTMYGVSNAIIITKDTTVYYTGKEEKITFYLKPPKTVEIGNHKVIIFLNKTSQYNYFYTVEN